MAQYVTFDSEAVCTFPAEGRQIRYIVVHYTAGSTSRPGYADAIAKFFANSGSRASADFIVDDETVVQFNPDLENRFCRHCGDYEPNSAPKPFYGVCTNENSIGVELASTNSAGCITVGGDPRYSFTEAVLQNAAELIASLMKRYQINISHVVRHYDVSGKTCPGVPGWFGAEEAAPCWTAFKKRLTHD